MVIVPIYRSFDDHAELLRAFAQEHDDVLLVDLPAVLPARFTAPIDAYLLDAVHPTPEAHGLVAEAIHEVLAPRLR